MAIGPFRVLAVVAAMGVAALSGCGVDQGRTALAITAATRTADGALVVATECAQRLEVHVGPDHGGSDLPEITVWGVPEVGRCRPGIAVAVPPGTTKVVDGATSQVVDLSPPG